MSETEKKSTPDSAAGRYTRRRIAIPIAGASALVLSFAAACGKPEVVSLKPLDTAVAKSLPTTINTADVGVLEVFLHDSNNDYDPASVERVSSGGSSFILSAGHTIKENAHTQGPMDCNKASVQVTTPAGSTAPLSGAATTYNSGEGVGAGDDLAVFFPPQRSKVDSLLPAIPLASSGPAVGTVVYAVGESFTDHYQHNVSPAEYVGQTSSGVDLFIESADSDHIRPGNSGGPMLKADGSEFTEFAIQTGMASIEPQTVSEINQAHGLGLTSGSASGYFVVYAVPVTGDSLGNLTATRTCTFK